VPIQAPPVLVRAAGADAPAGADIMADESPSGEDRHPFARPDGRGDRRVPTRVVTVTARVLVSRRGDA